MRDKAFLIIVPVVLVIICWLVGFVTYTCIKKTVGFVGERIVAGFVVCIALFQILALPFMFYEYDFIPLYYLYLIALLLLLVAGIVMLWRKKKYADIKKELYISLHHSRKEIVVWGTIAIGVFFQIAYVVLHQHTDIDDSFYIAQTNTILETGKVLNMEPASGLAEFPFQVSYKLVGWEVLLAVVAKFFDLNAAFLCHTVLPVLLIALHYLIISGIAQRINKQSSAYFVLLYMLVNLFSGYSGYSQGAFLLYRIWQGKAVMINIIVPVLILTFLGFWDMAKVTWKECLYIVVVLVSGFATTTVAIYLMPIAYFGLTAGYLFIKRNIWNTIKLCIPVVLVLPYVGLKLLVLLIGENAKTENAIVSAGSGAGELSYVYELIDKFMAGNKILLICILLALICILIKGNEKEKGVLAVPLVVLLITFCNPFLMEIVARYITGSPIYWRLFWLLEFPMLIVAAIVILVRNISDREVHGFFCVIGSLVIVINGSYILNQSGFVDRENKYKLDHVSIAIADMVLEDAKSYENPDDELVLLLPVEISYSVREYTGEISLLMNRYAEGTFGNAGREADWDRLNEKLIQPLYVEQKAEENLYTELQYFDVDYVALPTQSLVGDDAADGLGYVGEYAGYSIYRMQYE